MSAANQSCRQCGMTLDATALGGLCPRCVALDFFSPAPDGGREAEATLIDDDERRLGDYELLEEIARGGMGVVYRARQTSLGREVAVKMILHGVLAGDTAIARFKAEAAAAARLSHPSIVAIHEIGEHRGRHFFSMEFVAGRTLAEIVREGPLPSKVAAGYLERVAAAVHYAHQRGVLHRDLKPSNILIDGQGAPRVTDFGLAKRFDGDSDLTLTGQVLGTPAYIPPEQAGGARFGAVDARSDVYSLGAVLYHLLCGLAPFTGVSVTEILHKVTDLEPIAPRLLNPGLPRDLETICLKCLAKEPSRRYGTARELAEDLGRFLRGEPILARPLGRVEKLWRWSRRQPALAAALAGCVFILVGGVSGILWQLRQTKAAQAVAVQKAKDEETQRRAAQQSELVMRQNLYAADMRLAQQSLKENNWGFARQLLDRHRPRPGEEDLRGWEWRYLWQLTRSSALVTLTNRNAYGFSASFNPDGTRLAVGWSDGQVDLWDVPARRWLRAFRGPQNLIWGHVAFAPARNLLAATSDTNAVSLYDLDSGQETVLWRAPGQHLWNVRDLSFSPDGSKLVVYASSMDDVMGDAVSVVNVSSGEIENRQATDNSGSGGYYFAGAARLSPDNHRLYLPHFDPVNHHHSLACVDLATGREVWRTENQPDPQLTALALSPDGRFLASGSFAEDTAIHIWDTATGRLVTRLEGHTSWVRKLMFARDDHRLISSSSDQTIRIWDTDTWQETAVLRGHTHDVPALAVSEAAHLIASGSKDGDLMLWQTDTPGARDGRLRLPREARPNDILPLDNSRVLVCPTNQPTALFDLRQGVSLGPPPGLGTARKVFLVGCTNWVACWNGTNQLRVAEWTGSQFVVRDTINLVADACPIWVSFNPSRRLVAWSETIASNSVFLAGLAAPDRRIEFKSDRVELTDIGVLLEKIATFREDGKYLAVGSLAGLRVWNVDTGQSVINLHYFSFGVFAAGGSVLVATGMPSNNISDIQFFQLDHPERPPRRVLENYPVTSLTLSPDGRQVAVTIESGMVRLYDAASGDWLANLQGHQLMAEDACFSPDGKRMITCSGGREAVKLWDIATGQELLNLTGSGSHLLDALWSADGDTLLAGAPWQAWHAPSWAEINAAEDRNPPSPGSGGPEYVPPSKP